MFKTWISRVWYYFKRKSRTLLFQFRLSNQFYLKFKRFFLNKSDMFFLIQQFKLIWKTLDVYSIKIECEPSDQNQMEYILLLTSYNYHNRNRKVFLFQPKKVPNQDCLSCNVVSFSASVLWQQDPFQAETASFVPSWRSWRCSDHGAVPGRSTMT